MQVCTHITVLHCMSYRTQTDPGPSRPSRPIPAIPAHPGHPGLLGPSRPSRASRSNPGHPGHPCHPGHPGILTVVPDGADGVDATPRRNCLDVTPRAPSLDRCDRRVPGQKHSQRLICVRHKTRNTHTHKHKHNTHYPCLRVASAGKHNALQVGLLLDATSRTTMEPRVWRIV